MPQPPHDILSRLLSYARTQGATQGDAVLFENTQLALSRRLHVPENLERSESASLGLRVFCGHKQAMVSSTDLNWETLKELAHRAVSMARASTQEPDATLAPENLLATDIKDLDLFDAGVPDEAWLMAQAEEAEDAALNTPGITNSEGADAHYSAHTATLVTSLPNGKGFAGSYRSSSYSICVSVLAGEGEHMERDYDYAHTRFCKDLPNAASIGKSAAERALKRLHPRKAPTCRVPVVYDPKVSKGLLSAFCGAICGGSVARGTSFLKHHMGKPVFSKHIRIIDDPHIIRGLSSRPFDAEGVQNQKRTLVEQGILQSWLLDMRSANKLGLTTTGHAARGASSTPSASSTNLYMQAGSVSPKELISDIKGGLYVTEVFGMGVNLVTGDYSQGASGFWIENGEISHPVSEITIAGNLLDMFAHATPASDLQFRYATNCPTLRIEGMTVAGS